MNEDEISEIKKIFELCENAVESGRPAFQTLGRIESIAGNLLGYEFIIESKPESNTWRK